MSTHDKSLINWHLFNRGLLKDEWGYVVQCITLPDENLIEHPTWTRWYANGRIEDILTGEVYR